MAGFKASAQEAAWCPGCGNYPIREAVLKALNSLALEQKDVLWVSGIGQAAKAPHYIETNFFNGLHGRSLAAATGAKLANPNLKVIVESGDGCHYGEGGNHFMAALRRNIGLTVLVHDNQIYGLTKGQASPTTATGQVTKSQPQGVFNQEFHPLSTAITLGAGFVARGFSGDQDQLTGLISQAVQYPGLALIDILMPCVSFNPVNTFAWYKKRVRPLPAGHNPADPSAALAVSQIWGDEIPTGLIYRRDPNLLPPLEQCLAAKRGLKAPLSLIDAPPDRVTLAALMGSKLY